jgi:hypothetical protein
MWCPMMPAHSWRTLLGSPRAYGVNIPPINPNYAGGHRLSSLIRVSRRLASVRIGNQPRRRSKSLPYDRVRRTPRADRPGSLQDHRAVTRGDTSLEVLRCGEALSTVLLERTVAGIATCTLTHLTEITPSRMVIPQLTRERGLPQLLIRVGTTPAAGEQQLPPHPDDP